MLPDCRTQNIHIPESSTSHSDDPAPTKPIAIPKKSRNPPHLDASPSSSAPSIAYTSGSEYDALGTPASDSQVEEAIENKDDDIAGPNNPRDDQAFVAQPASPRKRRASTKLISSSPEDVRRILSPFRGAETKEIGKVCCGGGCCLLETLGEDPATKYSSPIVVPDNEAFRTLQLRLGSLGPDTELSIFL